MMRDEKGLRRQWALLRALSSARHGIPIKRMAEELGVTERTIRRDLGVFRSVGFPLEEHVGEFGRKTWRIVSDRAGPPLTFTFDEAVALYLGRELLEPLAGTFVWEASRNAFRKVRAALGREALEYLDGFAQTFHQTGVVAGDYEAKAELYDGLQVAIEDRREVRLLYRSEGAAAATARPVHPYGVAYHRGTLYLVAMDPARGEIRHYKLDRIEEAEPLAGRFPRPEGFDLASHLATAFGVYRDGEPTVVRVRFGPTAARYVQEARRHGSQKFTPLADGSVLAEYTVSGTEEIKRWVLGFGAKAEVLEPGTLRREVLAELRAMVSSYTPVEEDS